MSSTRVPLSRDRILATALAVADEAGAEAVTMRKLADRLGFEAMSLYRHVASKDDLLGGMLDLVLAEWEPPADGGDWRAAVRASAVSVHGSLRRHPWAAPLLMSMKGARPVRLAYMDALLRRLREAGFDADTTYHAYHVLDGHIFGFSMWETSHMVTPDQARDLLEQLQPLFERFPDLMLHRDQHLHDGPHRQVSAFEFGLDLILDGLRDR